MGLKNHLRWVVCVLGVLCVLILVVRVAPGAGVQHQLDARAGLESQVFQQSLRLAMARMTPVQIEAYNWAVSDLDAKSFVARYGSTPSVREVIVGQVTRVVDEGRKRAALLDAQLQKTPERVTASRSHYQQALDQLRTYQPVVTHIEYSDRKWVGASNRAQVSYKLIAPKGLHHKILLCRLTWQVGSASSRQSQDFDCLAQKRNANGEYFVTVPTFRGRMLSAVELGVEMCQVNSMEKCSYIHLDSAEVAQEAPPELVELWRIKNEMSRALGYKSRL